MSTPAQVFVDDSGRRLQWVRLAGAGVTVLCAGYIGIVVVGLSQTAVGPLEAVPEGGNGVIAGFQNSAGAVPGLLAQAGSPRAVSQGGHAAVPTRRAVAVAPARTTRAAPATISAKRAVTSPGSTSGSSKGSAGAGKAGSGKAGLGKAGSGEAGSGKAGSGKAGSSKAGSGSRSGAA